MDRDRDWDRERDRSHHRGGHHDVERDHDRGHRRDRDRDHDRSGGRSRDRDYDRGSKRGSVDPDSLTEEELAKYKGLFSQGDWKCPMCGNVNWSRRAECNMCNARKPGLIRAERTGAGGGFRERTVDDVEDQQVRKQMKEKEIEERKKEKKRCTVCKRFACIC
eukprot:Rmarinus@m.21679